MGLSTRAIALERQEKAKELFLLDFNPKEIAGELGISTSHVHRVLQDAGIVKLYVTKSEERMIRSHRPDILGARRVA